MRTILLVMVQEFYKKLVKSIYENEGTFLKRGSDNYSYKQLRKVLEGFFWQFSQIERQPIVIVAEKSLEMYAAIIAIMRFLKKQKNHKAA